MADTPPVILADTKNYRLRSAMLLGSALEGGWTSPYPVGDHGTSFGPFQLHQGGKLDSLGGTPQQAEDPRWAVKAMMPDYSHAVNQISDQLWTNNPEAAAEQAARIAEQPAQSYFASQGRQTVNAKWHASQQILAGKHSTGGMPVDVGLTSAGDLPIPVGGPIVGSIFSWLFGGGGPLGSIAGGFKGNVVDWLERGGLILFGALLVIVGILVLAAPGAARVAETAAETRSLGRRTGVMSTDAAKNFEARSAEREADRERRTAIADRSLAIGERKVSVMEQREQRLAT